MDLKNRDYGSARFSRFPCPIPGCQHKPFHGQPFCTWHWDDLSQEKKDAITIAWACSTGADQRRCRDEAIAEICAKEAAKNAEPIGPTGAGWMPHAKTALVTGGTS